LSVVEGMAGFSHLPCDPSAPTMRLIADIAMAGKVK